MTRAMYGAGDILVSQGHAVDYAFMEDLHLSSPNALRRFAVPWRIPRLVQELQSQSGAYDVVEIHEPSAAGYCFRQKAFRLPPITIFSHGPEARGREAFLTYRAQKRIPIPLRRRFGSLTVTLQAMYSFRRAQQIICLNSMDRHFLLESGVDADAITQLKLGVDQQLLDAGAARTTWCENSCRLLFMGTWIERKGIIDLVAAAVEVLDEHPRATLTIAGFGFPDDTVSLAFPARLRPRLRLVQKLNGNQELINLYNMCDVLILPSFVEGQPLVMLEAAAMGLAIVGTNTSGMRDFLSDGRGILVPIGAAKQLADAISSLVHSPVDVAMFGKLARAHAQSYTWSNSAAELLSAYSRAISRYPASA